MAKILLGVCGGIAAYKVPDLASMLVKEGHEVKCVLTANAQKFIAPLCFATITHNPVETGMFTGTDPIAHISLADWADLVVIAPATANMIAKAAHGIADDLLSCILLAHTRPVLFVPAMNVHMYQAVATGANMALLKSRGHHILEPETGILACGYVGKGKYPPSEEVMAAIYTYLAYPLEDLAGIKVLITSGATREALDPMRFISNKSSGKMGFAIARACRLRGAEVCLIQSVVDAKAPYYMNELVCAESALEMKEAVMSRYQAYDWIIQCAAVADYMPRQMSNDKLPKSENMTLDLVKTPDILAELGSHKLPGQKLIGFAAQTGALVVPAVDKYNRKNLDMICANDINVAGQNRTRMLVMAKLPGIPALPEAPELSFLELEGDKLTVAQGIIDAIKMI